MSIIFNFGSSPSVLPTISEDTILHTDETVLRLFLLLASTPRYRRTETETLAAVLGKSEEETAKALETLASLGILSTGDSPMPAPADAVATAPAVKPPKRTRTHEFPTYTDDELTATLESNKPLNDLITEAQNALGKMLNLSETKILVSIAECFDFNTEFLLILFSYCRKIGKTNLRWIEKLSVTLYEENVGDCAELTEFLKRREETLSVERKIRTIFGIGSRALTVKEKEYITVWTEKYKFGFDVIGKAYEITVNATSKPSMSYAAKILDGWFAEGLDSVEKIDEAKQKKESAGKSSMSFDINEFFKAAVDHSYNDD